MGTNMKQRKLTHFDLPNKKWHMVEDRLVYRIIKKEENKNFRKIFSFDLDNTLILSNSFFKPAQHERDYIFYSNNIISFLKEKYEEGYKIIIFSNQKGVSVGKISLANIINRVEDVLNKLNIPVECYLALKNDKYRKPRIGMFDFMKTHNNNNEPIEELIYVGDLANRVYDHNFKQKFINHLTYIYNENKVNIDIKEIQRKLIKDYRDTDLKFALNLNAQFFTPEELFLNIKNEIPKTFLFEPKHLDKEQNVQTKLIQKIEASVIERKQKKNGYKTRNVKEMEEVVDREKVKKQQTEQTNVNKGTNEKTNEKMEVKTHTELDRNVEMKMEVEVEVEAEAEASETNETNETNKDENKNENRNENTNEDKNEDENEDKNEVDKIEIIENKETTEIKGKMKTTKRVVILVGAPGSGKTSFSNNYFPDFKKINLKLFKTRKKVLDVLKTYLYSSQNIIIDDENRTVADRKLYIDIIRKSQNGIRIEAVYFNYSKDLVIHLNTFKLLTEEINTTGDVPTIAIHSFYKYVQQPSIQEGFDKITILYDDDFVPQNFPSEEQKRLFFMYLN